MKKNVKKKGKARKVWGVILIVYACIHLLSLPYFFYAARTDPFKMGGSDIFFSVLFLFLGIPAFLGGIKLLKTADWDEIWETADPGKAPRLIRKVSRIHDDYKLLDIGRDVGLDEVADAAFGNVRKQASITEYLCANRGSTKRLKMALSYLTDENELCQVVIYKGTIASASGEIRKEALKKINNAGLVEKMAADTSLTSDLRIEAHEHLREIIQRQGGDVRYVDYMIAHDVTMPFSKRVDAFEALGEKEEAEKLRRRNDQEQLFDDKHGMMNTRRAAGMRILATGDEDWVRTNVNRALNFSGVGSDPVADFLVETAKKYPDMIRQMWPRLKTFAHTDSTRHEDGHFDNSHNDYTPSLGYGIGKHYDGINSSDCTHSDAKNENIHTDNPGENYLSKFPPYIKE